MKNLLIYTNPIKEFSEENKTLVKIQIDNSLDLGWKREDILLYTNFDYQYNGIKSIIVDDILDWKHDRTSNKIFVIRDLLHKRLPKDLYWYHDFDAHQNEVIQESELGLDKYVLGLTGYGYKDQINGGSFFFRETATNIFDLWCDATLKNIRTRADEKTMTDLTRAGMIHNKMLNITYNFGQRGPALCYEMADKPIKVLHFHPNYRYYNAREWNLDIFMYGKNKIGVPMMSKRLIKVFQKHGIS